MPKRDPLTGQFLPSNKRRAAARTAASSVSAWFRANPTRKKRPAKSAKRKTTRAPKRRTAKRRTRR